MEANEAWLITQGLVNFIVFLAGGIYAVEKLSVPFKKLMNMGKKSETEEQRIKKIEGWTGNQQDDIDLLNEGFVILARGQEAILDHIIVKQEGNGKCHAAQREIDDYLKKKSLAKKSCK
ncbi:MAG: hypothetical protein R3Y63_04220 [Eubacteriales bacterium]